MRKEHVLIIRFSAMGDVAMMVPVVYSVATQYPQVRFTVLSRPFARPLFADLAPNVDFMAADLNDEYHGVKGLNSLYRRLVAKQFTKVADLHNVLRSEYLRMRFNLGRYRVEHVNKHRHDKRALISNNNKVREPLPTVFQNYSEVLARLGYPFTPSFHSIFPEEKGNLNLLPASIGPKKNFEQWIGVAPMAAHKGKVYPLHSMRQVVEQLSQKYPKARFFFFGRGRKETQLFAEWCRTLPRCLDTSLQLENLHQELILMSHLDVMISMDSANMHLASLVNTPVVSIWGATHRYAGFLGWGQKEENVVELPLDCRPCSIYGERHCPKGTYECMRDIDPQTIVDKVLQQLSSLN
jgi:ADP-heptose:LPS heptosyltransferase